MCAPASSRYGVPARLTRTGLALISVSEPEAEDEENSS